MEESIKFTTRIKQEDDKIRVYETQKGNQLIGVSINDVFMLYKIDKGRLISALVEDLDDTPVEELKLVFES